MTFGTANRYMGPSSRVMYKYKLMNAESMTSKKPDQPFALEWSQVRKSQYPIGTTYCEMDGSEGDTYYY